MDERLINNQTKLKLSTNYNGTDPRKYYDANSDRRIIERIVPPSILIETVIRQLCAMIESDPLKRKKLFYSLKLHNKKMLDISYTLDDRDSIKGQYPMNIIYQLCKAVVDSNSVISPDWGLLTDSWRYLLEFEELSFLGSGGFGAVYKARHRLDGNEYAVKKICVRPNQHLIEHLEEVKTLAKLDHTNIVSYKGAWLEKTWPRALRCLPTTPNNSICLALSESPKDSDPKSINSKLTLSSCCSPKLYDQRQNEQFSDNSKISSSNNDIHPEKRLDTTTHIIDHINEKSSNSVSFRYNTRNEKKSYSSSDVPEASTEESDIDCISDRRLCQYKSVHGELTTLYIQMALCDKTLREWLDERQEVSSNLLVLQILSQIVAGLQYIHSQNTVHHDIKPENIFISTMEQMHIQLGDFGLACPLQQDSHHPNCGTQLYAAPEQLAGKCDPKSDVYSLGVVLFEILVPMKTSMECCDKINQFKEGQVPDAIQNHPHWVEMLKRLLDSDPLKRPTTTDLLHQLSKDKDVIIASKDKIIQNLEDENEKLRDELKKLQLKLQD